MDEKEDEAASFAQASEEATSTPPPKGWPRTYWTFLPNRPPGRTHFVIEGEGILWVLYEPGGTPASRIGIWHRKSEWFEPIEPGENNFEVVTGDTLFYEMASPRTDRFKLVFEFARRR
jgi:hypothetical protein